MDPGISCKPASLASMKGLNEALAQARLLADGHNELPRADRRTAFRIVLEVLREPMFALLLAGGAIYLALGDPKEAIVLLCFASLSVVITVVQETRTERVLEALRDLTSPRALVIRDGVRKRIAGRDVVRGDLVVLAEGDRVPADALLIEGQNVETDESLLTGESVPVRKRRIGSDASPAACRPGGDDLPYLFSGTLVVRGSGIAEVTATGAGSEIGKIGKTLATLERGSPRLQIETRRLVTLFGAVGGAVSLVAVLLYGILGKGWLAAVLAGIALGMSMLPEEFPVVLTVFMAMGAWRISRAGVLTRRASAIETLGSATVLCTDKTGTLTENRMSVAALRLRNGEVFRPSSSAGAGVPVLFKELVAYGVLASGQDPFDPMEKAFHALGRVLSTESGDLDTAKWELVHVYGLVPGLLAVSQVWKDSSGGFVVAAKGAPEAIADLCGLDSAEDAALRLAADSLAREGLRVLGIARATSAGPDLPQSHRAFAYQFLGLAGLADPLRANVPAAVEECRSAGIRVVMITGDYPATARAIARQAGLATGEIVIGDQLSQLSETELAQRVRRATIFARIMPEQKLRIINAFKANGEIVAMTGDGVNDAPSIKAADIGIAMGGRGTDVAREASSIVLVHDDFGSIVKAIRLGRRIYDNLRKAMGFILAVHVPIAGLALLPLLLGLPILFGPMHIAFLEMVIDPVCSLVFEAEVEEDDVMRRPPRPPKEALFSTRMIIWGLVQGALAFLLVVLIFIVAMRRGMAEDEVRALAFFSLVMAIIGLIFVNRSFGASVVTALWRPNWALRLVLVVVALVSALALLWPLARGLFHFGPLHLDDIALTLAVGLAVLVALDLLKSFMRRLKFVA